MKPTLMVYLGTQSFVVWRVTESCGVVVMSDNPRFPAGELYYNYSRFDKEWWNEYDGEIVLKNGKTFSNENTLTNKGAE